MIAASAVPSRTNNRLGLIEAITSCARSSAVAAVVTAMSKEIFYFFPFFFLTILFNFFKRHPLLPSAGITFII